MTLREALKTHVATDEELKKSEDAATKEASEGPRGVHNHLAGMIGDKITECRAHKVVAEIIEGLFPAEKLDEELGEKENLFVPMMLAKQLLIRTFK